MNKRTFLVVAGAIVSLSLMGAGCASLTPSPTGGIPATQNPAPAPTPISGNNTPNPAPNNSLTAKINDLNVSMSYPSDWGTASAPASLKTAAGASKTISFSAFSNQVGSVDIFYYSANYKPTKDLPTPYPLTATTCDNFVSKLQSNTVNGNVDIQDCVRLDTNGKTIMLFTDKRVSSYVGLLYTGDATYPLLELISNLDSSYHVDRQTFESVLRSIK